MDKLFPRGIRVCYWHRNLRRDVFIAIGLIPAVGYIIYVFNQLRQIMPPSQDLVVFFQNLVLKVDWVRFLYGLLPSLYVALFFEVVLVLGASYWYWRTYQFKGFWATIFRLERLANWLIANQYYLVKEVDDQKKHSFDFNFKGEKGGWHW